MKTRRIHLVLLLSCLPVACISGWAADFNVNSLGDAVDASVGDGICATSGGACTLRAAIQEANFFSDADTINLPDGTITLAIPGADEDASLTGDLDVIHDVTVAGPLVGSSRIDGNGAVTQDRVFEVHGGTLFLLIQKSGGVTVAKGKLLAPINAGQNYIVNVSFTGSVFNVLLDGVAAITVPAGAAPSGNAGFRVKSSTGLPATARFEQIVVQ